MTDAAKTARIFPAGLFTSYGTLADFTSSVDTYADVGTVDCRAGKTKTFNFTELNMNAMKVQVLGSLDNGVSYPIVAMVEITIAKNAASGVKTITDMFTHLKVQAKPSVGGAHGKIGSQFFVTGL